NTGEGTLAFSFPEWVEDDGGTRAPLAYCAASGGCDEYIGTVQFGTINNSSGCSNYADYTSISTEVEPGETYPITVSNPVPWSSDIVGIYIDWNQDEDFDDASEFYTTTSSGGGATFTGNILVPDDAEAGLTRMRVRLQYGGTLSPCGTTSYGEVEDYTLDVKAGGFIVSVVPAEGTVPPGGSRTIAVTWDATDFEPGFSYFEDLVVESNDLANPSVTITNEMYVYVPAQFAGTVTNALNGEPLNGVLVTANPTGYFTTISYDDGTAESGWGINEGYDAYLGNYFPVSVSGVVQSIDLHFIAPYGDDMTTPLTVDFFDISRNYIGSSEPFLVTAADWYNVPVPNVEFNGPFYAMAHWNITGNMRYMSWDSDGPNAAAGYGYIMEGGVWSNTDLGAGVFILRANAFIGANTDLVVLDASQLTPVTDAIRLRPSLSIVKGQQVNTGRKAGQMNLNNSRDFTTFQAMTDENGEYMMYVDAGRYNVSFEKLGFQTYVEYDTIALQGVVTPLDAQLWEEAYPPSFVYAEVNETDTECVVTWGDGVGPYEIVYDDGSAENYAAWALPGNMNAVKFTPANYPVTVLGGKIYVGDGSFPNNNTGFLGSSFGAMVKDDDGPNGMPGTTLDSISVTVNNYGWVIFTGLDVEITEGNFYLVMVQGSLSPNCAPVGVDENLPTLYRSYSRNISAGGNWVVAAFQDMMMRAIVSGTPAPTDALVAENAGELIVPVKQRGMISMRAPLAVPGHEGKATYIAAPEFDNNSRSVTNYRLVRYSNFDPNGDPTLGDVTGLGNAINANTYTDGGSTWANLPAGWYAYGVAANYPNNYVSDTVVSNIVGHKILAEITVNVSLTTGGSPAGAVVSLAGQAYPYEVYTATVPEDGQVIFPAVWYGPYVVEAMKVGFDDYMINVNITGDRVINIILLEKKYKPRNLYVDPLTLVATWDEPLAIAAASDFEEGVFPPAGWQALTQSTTGWYATTNGSSSAFAIPPHTTYAVSNDDAENGNGCCDYLITPEMNWTDLPTYRLNFASYYDGSYGQSAYVEISTDAGTTWTVISSMVAAPGAWQDIEIDLAQFSGASGLNSVWLAFHADDNGAWASGWAVDDVQIASGGVPLQGYGVFLDGTLVDNTPEQTYTYTNLNFGQEYLAGVAALYSSGYSELDTYLFRSAYLYPPDSLEGMSPPMTDYAHLTWLPPTSPTGLGDNQDRVAATETQPAADVVAVLTPRTFPQTNVPLASNRNVLYDNGPLVNSPGTGSGGADESILQTGLGMGTYGFGMQQSAGNSVADDFEVTGNWNIQNIEFFGYQTGSSTSSTFTGVFCRVYDGAPNAGGTVIWGDLVTNRMISTEWSNIYRNDNGPGGSTDRPVMRIVAETPGLTLSPGTYWVEWQTTGSLSSGPWVPAVTINGETTTGNALQYTGSWAALVDVGPQGLPFIINGTGGGGGGGAVPSNLLGYNLYRDDVLRVYVEHPQTEYFDLNLDPGTYSYHVTAVYDLTPYGFAGQTGESMIEGPIEVSVVYGYELPFVENFNTGLFETNQWTTDGENWRIAGQVGNPAPSAEFTYNPPQADYGLSLSSFWINGTGFIDGSIFLDFDMKLDDVNATGEESLQVEVFNGSSWITVATYTAEGDMDWEMKHIDITSQAKNKVFRVRFNAKGLNSLDIFNWMIDNVHIYRECAAPTELTADVNLPYVEQVVLNWVAPSGSGPGPSGWLFWDNGVNDDAIGLTGGGTFNVAVRFTPTQLAQYAGTSLTKIRLFPYSDGGTIALKVWTGANASTLVLTQPIATYVGGEWNEFVLNTPVPVTGATELWFGYSVTHPDGVYVAGCDAGPAVAGFGDMLSLDGSVWESMATAYGLNYNWNLQGYVETLDGVAAALQPISDPTVYGPVSRIERGNLPALPGAALPVEVSGNRELVGYNIYRDGMMIGSATETTYIDADEALTIGIEYCYNVTAVYEDCESPMSEVACVLLTNVPVVDNQLVSIYPNPSNNLVNIELTNDISHMVVYNYLGEVVYERVITKDKTIVLNVRNYEAGAYLVKFLTREGESFTRKVVVTH
ncbi:GEVED domain-containing protein, partial [Lentimicrobium sp.]|uniref:GEVED domain-containing protein n=1 Tax=Lentimicrobium sp. TaxID=2034841 RepID=UPI002C88160D